MLMEFAAALGIAVVWVFGLLADLIGRAAPQGVAQSGRRAGSRPAPAAIAVWATAAGAAAQRGGGAG